MIFDVIIPASGSSVRFGGNKLMLPFGGVSVLENTVSAFLCRKNIKNIFVAVKEEDIEEVRKMLPYPQVIVCAGGETRFLSVYAGLNISTADAVLVHDAARPNVSQTLIDAVCSSVANRGSGVPSLPLSDSVRHILKDRIIGEDKNREHLVCVQTPQGYLAGELLDAYEQAFEDNCEFADESLLFSKYIRPTFTVPGDPYNVKITKSEDYEAIIFKTAIGYDLHKLEDSDDKNSVIFFGGVAVPSKKRVVAHSDGDSVIHALIDALFSAIGDTDIGVHFPDNNPQYKGISSVILLQEVAKIYETIGRRVKNISIIIVIDAPKLQNIVPEIKESLADTLNISPSDIGISCKTTEGTSPDTYIAYASVTVL